MNLINKFNHLNLFKCSFFCSILGKFYFTDRILYNNGKSVWIINLLFLNKFLSYD